MVRIFTTTFAFNHEKYDAIVTLLEKDSRMSVTVRVMDVSLHAFLPGGQLNYELGNRNAEIQHRDNALAQALKKSIAVAVERHLVS